MKSRTRAGLMGVLVLFLAWQQAFGRETDPAGAAMLQQAQQIIAAYHAGQPAVTNQLQVVYFVPKDGTPLPGYEERLDRVMNDISNFYRDGLERFGITNAGLPLERKDGKLVLHLIQGKLPASGYSYSSGNATYQEIRATLKGTMDVSREHVLVFYALCSRTNGGRYVFNAPYYGSGAQNAGVCHAADCELLDPLLLCDTQRNIVYTEHYYPRMEQTVAKFNSLYLGGTAHELGHGLGLPHDDGGEGEQSLGVSLMGQGNLNYREDVWGGKSPSYLSRGSALQLLSHPFFTGSNRGRWSGMKTFCASLDFSVTNRTLRIQGVITDAIPAYAVIAYAWHGDDDHFARSFPCLVKDGRFDLVLDGFKPGNLHHFHLRLAKLHVNGGTGTEEFPFPFDDKSLPDVAALNTTWVVDQAELAVMQARPDAKAYVSDTAIAAAPTPAAARELRMLRAVLEPVEPSDLGTVSGDAAFLSDAVWTEAKVGWGKVARNHFWFAPNFQGGVLFRLKEQSYGKGLYAHASSQYIFHVAGKWKTFTTTIGLQYGAQGSASFIVHGDGRELYRSQVLHPGQSEDVTVEISKVQKLELLTEGGNGDTHSSWAIWVGPEVLR